MLARLIVISAAALCSQTGTQGQSSVLIGTATVAPSRDFNSTGTAEAFQATATSSGTLASLTVYVDSSSTATMLFAGLYSDAAGNPGSLLATGSLNAPVSAAWNIVPIEADSITAGTKYWLAILGTGGTLRFRDQASGPCVSQSNRTTGLTALPATWTAGSNYRDCPASVYGSGSGTSTSPILSVSTNSLAFSMVVGGAQPGSTSFQVTNSGAGSLSFTAASDVAWLSVDPASGSSPATLQVTADGTGLAVGIYTGHITVISSGAQASPQNVTVTFNVNPAGVPNQPGDWLQVHHDSMRTGFASDEIVLSPSNAGTLTLSWSTSLDGQITAQPLFVGGVSVGGTTRDVAVSATAGNSVYALDAASGAVLWKQNFGTQGSNCVLSGGFGVSGTPVIDRTNQRVYAVSSAGVFYALSLATGAVVGQTAPIILNPDTNNVWGGLNQNGNFVYFATGSNGCDSQPWQGTIYKIDVSNPAPKLVLSVPVIPSLASTNNAGGGIWGYGGVAIDPASGNVYVTAAADVNESTTPYANRLIAYDANLNVLGSYLPSDPSTFPCSGGPCDLDFGSTPVVFTPAGCSQMVAGGKKNGNVYLFKTADLIAGSQPTQILTINTYNDSLGAGGAADPSYWTVGNMLFDGTAGPGANGFSGGVAAMKVTSSCTLINAWSQPVGGGDLPNSSVTIANGVALIGVGQTGQVLAFNASNGTPIWQSPTGLGNTFAAPMVAKGTVYAATWNGFGAGAGGVLRAYSLSPSNLPATLTVLPAALTFTATAGGANPSYQTLSVGNSGTGSIAYTASSDAAWLTVSPTSGSVPQNLTVSVDINGLSAGTLTGHITITATGALQSPQTVSVTLYLSSGSGGGVGLAVLLGDQVIESQLDYNPAGTAEAFQTTATATGTTASITFYLDASSSATQVAVGVYSDAAGHPGTLLTQASTSAPVVGTWNTLSVPGASVAQGSNYWVAILGSNGTIRFHDKSKGCASETSLSTNLATLPSTWSTGKSYTDCPLSAYVSH